MIFSIPGSDSLESREENQSPWGWWEVILYGAHEILSIPIQRLTEIHGNVQVITLQS